MMCCQTAEVQPHASLSARVTAELHTFDHDMFWIGRTQATGLDLIYALRNDYHKGSDNGY